MSCGRSTWVQRLNVSCRRTDPGVSSASAMPIFLRGVWSLVWPTDAVGFWTMIAGLGTVALTILAYRGLRSLVLAKSDMLTRAVRDARECAVARCEELAKVIIPANAEILTAIAANRVPVFVKGADEVRFDPDNAQDVNAAKTWIAALPQGMYGDSIRLLNSLEGWAMYFTNGLADHQIAFGPCAPVFCSMIVQNYGILLTLRSSQTAGRFPNAVKLFKSWLELLEHEKRGLREGNLLKQLAELQKKGGISHTLPKPLGTQLDE